MRLIKRKKFVSESNAIEPQVMDLVAAMVTSMDNGIYFMVMENKDGEIVVKTPDSSIGKHFKSYEGAYLHVLEVLGLKTSPNIVKNFNAWRARLTTFSKQQLIRSWPLLGAILKNK